MFSSPGGVDAINAQCYYTEDLFCGVAWFRSDVYASGLPDSDGATVYNCYGGAGAGYAPDSIGSMTLAECFEKCQADSQCDAIAYGWEAGDCYPRGDIDLTKCDQATVSRAAGPAAGWGLPHTRTGLDYSTFDVNAPERARKWTSQGFKNCFEGAGASGSSKPVGTLSIAACMDKCLESDKSDCGGVTVAWTDHGDGTVKCYLRSNIDIGSCEDGQKDKQWYTTFTRD